EHNMPGVGRNPPIFRHVFPSMKLLWFALPVCAAALFADETVVKGTEQPWKDKRPSEWTDEDAKAVMSDSPWAKTVTPQISRSQTQARPGGGYPGGRSRGGIGVGGVGVGFPGGRRGGYPGGGGTARRQPDSTRDGEARKMPELTVRWESA